MSLPSDLFPDSQPPFDDDYWTFVDPADPDSKAS